MINHFHCYLQTLEANLSRFMQSFLTSFAVSYNRRHKAPGHVFQGRYKAFIIEEHKEFRTRVSAYIHLSPSRIPSIKGAPFEDRKRVLREFEWSSYAAVIGLRKCPTWLDRDAVLKSFGKTVAERQAAYASCVEQAMLEDTWDPEEAAAAQTVIGRDSFVDMVRRGWTGLSEKASVLRETGRKRALAAWVDLETVIAAVQDEYGCGREELLRRWNRSNEARQVLLFLASTFCRGRSTLTAIADQLGPVSISGLTRARDLMEKKLKKDAKLRRRVTQLKKRLGEKSNS